MNPATALARCVGDPDRFVAQFWARRPLTHHAEEGFDDLLTLGDVDRLVSTMSLRLPAFRLVKDGSTLPPRLYTKTARTGSTTVTGLADPRRILREFGDGATIVLQAMHRYWPPLSRFCRELEIALGHPVQANAYITPAGSRGLALHHDSHDVFVLQLFGSKHWEVLERPGTAPSPPGGASSEGRREAALTAELEPGDCLYLPRGTPHAARTQETLSGHLTLGILTYTWLDLFREAFAMATKGPAFAEPLPVGFHSAPDAFVSEIERRLKGLRASLDGLDSKELAARTTRKFLTSRTPVLVGGLEDLLRLGSLHDGSLLQRRPAATCHLVVEDGELVAFLGDRELRMPAALLPAMRRIEARERFAPGELEDMLDAQSRLVLCRRLVREGLLEVVDG